MVILLLFYILCVAESKADNGNVKLIVGEEPVGIVYYPHMAYVDVKCFNKQDHVLQKGVGCGASILNQVFLLTSAHCLDLCTMDQYPLIRIHYGRTKWSEESLKEILVYKIHINSTYHRQTGIRVYDMALIKLRKPIEFDEFQQRVAIVRNLDNYRNVVESEAFIGGWGRIEEGSMHNTNSLKDTQQVILSREECAKLLSDITGYDEAPSQLYFCGRPVDNSSYPTKGDYGSPLVLDRNGFIQVGIASRAIYHPRYGRVMLYTDLRPREAYDWLQESARELYCTSEKGRYIGKYITKNTPPQTRSRGRRKLTTNKVLNKPKGRQIYAGKLPMVLQWVTSKNKARLFVYNNRTQN